MAILVMLLVIVVGIFVFSPLVSFVINLIKGGGDASACTVSLYGGKRVAQCPPDDVRIFYDKVGIQYGGKEYDSRDEEDYDEFLDINSRGIDGPEDMVKEALARLLRSCLQKGGGLNSRSFADRGGITCLECATISADSWSTGADGILKSGLEGLEDYLQREKPVGSSDKTYMGFLTRDFYPSNTYVRGGHSAAYIKGGIDGGLYPGRRNADQNKDYVVFYMGLRDDEDWVDKVFGGIIGPAKAVWDAIKFVTGDFKGALADAFKNDGVYFTYIIESSKLKDACPIKVN